MKEDKESEESAEDNLLLKLGTILNKMYRPGTGNHFDKTMSTTGVFNQLQELYPSDSYNPMLVYDLLVALDYDYDYIGGELEWFFITK